MNVYWKGDDEFKKNVFEHVFGESYESDYAFSWWEDKQTKKPDPTKRVLEIEVASHVSMPQFRKFVMELEKRVNSDTRVLETGSLYGILRTVKLIRNYPDPLAVRERVLTPEEVEVRTYQAPNDP